MTSPGHYAASDGSFAKSAGSAAARGAVLIGLAIVIGVLLLWKGFDGGDSSAAVGATDADTTDTAPPGDDDPTTTVDDDADPTTTVDDDADPPTTVDDGTATPAVADPPAEVTVMVLNATETGGLAGERSAALGAVGYVVTPGNAAVNVTDSKVYYTEGFADEAKEVVVALSGPGAVLEKAPDDLAALATDTYATETAAADVIVVLGTDQALE